MRCAFHGCVGYDRRLRRLCERCFFALSPNTRRALTDSTDTGRVKALDRAFEDLERHYGGVEKYRSGEPAYPQHETSGFNPEDMIFRIDLDRVAPAL